jgi:hypothetical protein
MAIALLHRDWRTSAAHLNLLARYRVGAAVDKYFGNARLEFAIGESVQTTIERFILERAIEPAPLLDIVIARHTIEQLKSQLRQRGLSTTGKKDALARRLVEHDPMEMYAATKGDQRYRCTESALPIVEAFIASEQSRRDSAVQRTLEFLQARDCEQATRVHGEYCRQSEAFGGGNTAGDVVAMDESEAKDQLVAALESEPEILRGMEPERRRLVCIAAAMELLWGADVALGTLPQSFETGIRLGADAACRMVVFHVWNVRRVRDFAELAPAIDPVFEVRSAGDGNTCAACRKLDGRRFKLRDLPELPYGKCKGHPNLGCRCSAVSATR